MSQWLAIWRDRGRRGRALIADISCTTCVLIERVSTACYVGHARRRTEAGTLRETGVAEIAACAGSCAVVRATWYVLHIHRQIEAIVALVLARYGPAEKKNRKQKHIGIHVCGYYMINCKMTFEEDNIKL